MAQLNSYVSVINPPRGEIEVKIGVSFCQPNDVKSSSSFYENKELYN